MEQVSNTLQRIIAQALQRLPAEELPAAAWDFAAGKAVAEKTRVLGCNLVCDSSGEKQTLVVEVPDATWRAQLYAMTPQFLARLNQFIRIERIEFKLASPPGAAKS
jgi:mannitol-1-phosphate/altronate dehydrogenase